MIQSRPDSSLSLIESIDTARLVTKRLKADYALLHVMALDKNYVDVTDEKPLKPAIDYYSLHGDKVKQAKVKYYNGIIHYRARDYETAAVLFGDAMRLAENTDDIWLKGMICSMLTWTHNKNHNVEDELKYSSMACGFFSEYGDSLYIDSAIYCRAVALMNNRRFHEADSLFSMIRPGSRYYNYAAASWAENEVKGPEKDAFKARNLFETARDNGYRLSRDQLYAYAYSLVLTGDNAAADSIVERLQTPQTDAVSEWWLYSVCKEEGKTDDAFTHLEKHMYLQDSVVKARLAQSLYKAESEHLLLEAERANSERKETVKRLIMCGGSLLLIMLTLVIISLKRKLDLQKAYFKLLDEYAESKRALEELETSKNGHLLNYMDLYRKQYSRIGELYNKDIDLLYSLYGSAKPEVEDLKKTLSVISSAGRQKVFEDMVNRDFDGVMIKVRRDFPGFDEKTYRFIGFILIGLKDRTIASILNENSGTVRSRKSRLRKQILDAETPDHALYEALLNSNAD